MRMSGEAGLVAAVIDQLVKDCVGNSKLFEHFKGFPRLYWPVMVTSIVTTLTPEQVAEGIVERITNLASGKKKSPVPAGTAATVAKYARLLANKKRWEKRQQEKLSRRTLAKAG